MRRIYADWMIYLVLPLLLGGLVGILVLLPVNEFADFHEHNDYYRGLYGDISVSHFVTLRMEEALRGDAPRKLAFYAMLGGILGLLTGLLYGAVNRRTRKIEQLQTALEQDVAALIAGGESGNVEFKSSLRWDLKKGERNRALEGVILKTLAGFMNSEGGTLLIGVADDGGVVGIEHDYPTLKKKDSDGFEVALTTLVANKMGTANCRLVHPIFYELTGHTICRVIVSAAPHPVFVTHEGTRKFYLRTGGSTREMDIEQAIEFIATRWP